MNVVPPYFLTFLISLFLWFLLTFSFSPASLVSGVFVALLVSYLSAPRLQILDGLRLHAGFFWAVIKYLLFFFKALIKANLDVARKVISPHININPQMVRIHTRMESDLGRLLLANSITLTPGTLTVDVIQDELLIHWIDCPYCGPDSKDAVTAATRAIAEDFERYLKGFVK